MSDNTSIEDMIVRARMYQKFEDEVKTLCPDLTSTQTYIAVTQMFYGGFVEIAKDPMKTHNFIGEMINWDRIEKGKAVANERRD